MNKSIFLNHKMKFLAVILMCILGGAEVDLFIPSFPELQKVFNLSPFMVELTLGINLAAHCVTSLIVGSLGDRYGRKVIILLGLIIFNMGSGFCIFATEYWHLILGRYRV
jgi:DHA1 family bicyclomycin/chloramphenicol resistance-like MFS transporter